ncbi:MAG: long-chain fatty acid--CoA ligase [Chromatiales bacterium]|nr:long-chain fatty acid--CoA ligase [Chromatiales bacterium]
MTTDIIPLEQAKTLHGAFKERVQRSPNATAFVQYEAASDQWVEYSWQQTADAIARWQAVMQSEALETGDRVAVMLRNCWEWVVFDQAALGLGLVTVPLYTNDRPDNIAYILDHSDSKLLLIENNEQWVELLSVADQLTGLERIITLEPVVNRSGLPVVTVDDWLGDEHAELVTADVPVDSLATIVYTSGTTGRPKGVMLSHHNILWNATAGLQTVDIYPTDVSLSFLPLSHTLERTVGYYLLILAGAQITFARSIADLAEDLTIAKPTVLISVPRIFERVYAKITEKLSHDSAVVQWLFKTTASTGLRRFEYEQKRGQWHYSMLFLPILERLVSKKIQAKLGGRLRFAISGGAALSPEIAKLFIGLGVPIQQGYGLTESSPIISVNRIGDNIPESIGPPLPGVEIKVGEDDELLTRSPAVMLGYWKNQEATDEVIDADGWLHTGDQVRIEEEHIFITGRLKEIIVMANGEKVSPADMEIAISLDSAIEQVIVIGEKRPYLSALVVPNPEKLEEIAQDMHLDSHSKDFIKNPRLHERLLDIIHDRLRSFPGYAEVRRIGIVEEAWSIENGMMTPTMKLKRKRVLNKNSGLVKVLYSGH